MLERLEQLLSVPGTTEAELSDALLHLGPVTEQPGFWVRFVSSDALSPVLRRHCVFQLFHRHVKPGMHLSELRQILGVPRWLHRSDFQAIEDLGGTVPVRMTEEDTVLRLTVGLESGSSDIWAVYLRLSGKFTADQLYAFLSSIGTADAMGDALIMEIGFDPPVVNSISGKQSQ